MTKRVVGEYALGIEELERSSGLVSNNYRVKVADPRQGLIA